MTGKANPAGLALPSNCAEAANEWQAQTLVQIGKLDLTRVNFQQPNMPRGTHSG